MEIVIRNASADPIYRQIVEQIKAQIIDGRLEPGEALPSIRNLARDLQISVITTKRAYDELERAGFLDTVGGKGTFVADTNHELLREARMHAIEEHFSRGITEARRIGIGQSEIVRMIELLFDEDREV